jgi:hypothetical protein
MIGITFENYGRPLRLRSFARFLHDVTFAKPVIEPLRPWWEIGFRPTTPTTQVARCPHKFRVQGPEKIDANRDHIIQWRAGNASSLPYNGFLPLLAFQGLHVFVFPNMYRAELHLYHHHHHHHHACFDATKFMSI